MLNGIHPLLGGELLACLDEMGHGDTIVLADAHFPAARVGARVLTSPGAGVPELIRAVCSVLPLEIDWGPVEVMADDGPDAAAGGRVPIHAEIEAAAGLGALSARVVERDDFYLSARASFAVVRTGELRPFGNAILRKGLAVPLGA